MTSRDFMVILLVNRANANQPIDVHGIYYGMTFRVTFPVLIYGQTTTVRHLRESDIVNEFGFFTVISSKRCLGPELLQRLIKPDIDRSNLP